MHNTVKLHPDYLSLLFVHRQRVSALFHEIAGLHDIDHFSMDIINSQSEITTLSATPALQYNLITSKLWPFDGAFIPTFFQTNSGYEWQESYQAHAERIAEIKEQQYDFKFCFSLVRKIYQFYFIYSFATKKSILNAREYYCAHINEMLKIGDYCYKTLAQLIKQNLPRLTNFVPFQQGEPKNVGRMMAPNHLILVVNNDE